MAGDPIIIGNARKDSGYAPYCGRCSGLHRMERIAPFYWRHRCGAEHDERPNVSEAERQDHVASQAPAIIGRCGTCEYRGEQFVGSSGEPTTYFLCQVIEHLNGSSLMKEDYTAGLGAGVKDGSGYHAALCVETDFGCVKWKAKT